MDNVVKASSWFPITLMRGSAAMRATSSTVSLVSYLWVSFIWILNLNYETSNGENPSIRVSISTPTSGIQSILVHNSVIISIDQYCYRNFGLLLRSNQRELSTIATLRFVVRLRSTFSIAIVKTWPKSVTVRRSDCARVLPTSSQVTSLQKYILESSC
jgi:hypothetical protein